MKRNRQCFLTAGNFITTNCIFNAPAAGSLTRNDQHSSDAPIGFSRRKKQVSTNSDMSGKGDKRPVLSHILQSNEKLLFI